VQLVVDDLDEAAILTFGLSTPRALHAFSRDLTPVPHPKGLLHEAMHVLDIAINITVFSTGPRLFAQVPRALSLLSVFRRGNMKRASRHFTPIKTGHSSRGRRSDDENQNRCHCNKNRELLQRNCKERGSHATYLFTVLETRALLYFVKGILKK